MADRDKLRAAHWSGSLYLHRSGDAKGQKGARGSPTQACYTPGTAVEMIGPRPMGNAHLNHTLSSPSQPFLSLPPFPTPSFSLARHLHQTDLVGCVRHHYVVVDLGSKSQHGYFGCRMTLGIRSVKSGYNFYC
ncbi:hypothetical protein RRG08_025609 [Elysia crispata]|uniref:Uncharacterized protein n=1 Tax=Elysia crispata TaxID=231223 RepID=A0AAE0YED6_9GAST|nr:hypothetical protein RRG08_025609 [Elysia crispata]